MVKYNEVSFAYNASGIRQEKTANTVVHKYHLEGTRIHKETYGNNTLWYYYDQTGITGLEYNGSKYYFQKNIQNDVTRIFDQYGILVASYEYDAWGNHKVLNANGFETTEASFIGNINPFRYRGYYYDTETGLYYLNSRYYDPRIGRFINADSIAYLAPESINGLNLYAYCGNNPIVYADPYGYSPEWWQWLINSATTALGIVLCFVPGGQVFGAGLIVSGVSGLIANTMDAMGLDSELAMKIQSGLNIVGGIGLSFVPGLGALGASMIGAGVLSFAGGYISESLGGGYALGWSIGNVVGSIAGGMVYKGIVNKISTPSNMIKSFENHPNRWKLTGSDISTATGKNYRGGISNYSHYQNIWTKAQMGTHTITVNDIIKHFHYFF